MLTSWQIYGGLSLTGVILLLWLGDWLNRRSAGTARASPEEYSSPLLTLVKESALNLPEYPVELPPRKTLEEMIMPTKKKTKAKATKKKKTKARSAKTGEYVSKQYAKKHKATTVLES